MKKIVHDLGLDVHKESSAVAIAPQNSTEAGPCGFVRCRHRGNAWCSRYRAKAPIGVDNRETREKLEQVMPGETRLAFRSRGSRGSRLPCKVLWMAASEQTSEQRRDRSLGTCCESLVVCAESCAE